MAKKIEPTLLTDGNPARRIIVFALPIFFAEFLGIFYTMADAFIVGRWLGINGLAAVGTSYNLICFFNGFAIGLSSGFTVITAQRVGAGNEEDIRRSVASGITLCFFASVALTALLMPLSRPLLTLIHTPQEIIDDANGYVLIIMSGILVSMFNYLLFGIIQAGGDSFTPTVFYVIGNVCNIILDIICVVVLHWGIRGVALATVFSQVVAAFLSFRFLVKRFPQFLPKKIDWVTARSDWAAHLSLGVSMGFQRSIVEVGNILVQASINSLGALTIAAVTAAQRVRGFNMAPLFAVSRAQATYVAQNYGAKKMDRVYKGIFQGCLINLGIGIFMAVLNLFTGAPIVSLFLIDSPEAIILANRYILFTGYTVFILGIMLVFRSSLQGLGQRFAPNLCGVMETVMSIFAAFILIPNMGFTGVCLVNPLSWFASGIPLYIAFVIYWKKTKEQISIKEVM